MKNFPFYRKTKKAFIERIDALREDAKPAWGTLDAPRMVKHLSASVSVSLGDVPFEDMSTFFSRNIAKRMVLYVTKKIPKGIQAPEKFTPPPDMSFDKERLSLEHELERFLDMLEADPIWIVKHPFLGSMSMKQWSRLHAIHMDHHLRQFGV